MDGTKIKANASRHKSMSYGRMQTTEAELKAQIATLLQKAANTDEAEKNEPYLDIPAEVVNTSSDVQQLPMGYSLSHAEHGQSPKEVFCSFRQPRIFPAALR